MEDAEEHFHISRRCWNGKSTVMAATILKRETEDHSLSHPIDPPQPPAQLIQKAAKQKQERFNGFDLAIEIKCLRIFGHGTDQTKQALVASGYLPAQGFGDRAKALDCFHFWQGKKFPHATNPPAMQNSQKFFGRFESLNGQAAGS